jgi:hypothetical protein
MKTPSTTPSGEPLPEYPDDERGTASPQAIHARLVREHADRWGDESVAVSMGAAFDTTAQDASQAMAVYERTLIADVLAALQAVGDATLVANGTYRALRRDQAELEALAAFLANGAHPESLLLADGHAADAAIKVIQAQADEIRRLRPEPVAPPVFVDHPADQTEPWGQA